MNSQAPPERPANAARTVRIAEDRDGQRIDNFLLGCLKGPRAAWSTSCCGPAR